MGVVHVYLQDGFDHDHVTVGVGTARQEVPDATTRRQIGLAEVVDAPVPDGERVAVAVAVPGRHLTAETTVDPTATPHVRVDIVGGSLVLRAGGDAPLFA